MDPLGALWARVSLLLKLAVSAYLPRGKLVLFVALAGMKVLGVVIIIADTTVWDAVTCATLFALRALRAKYPMIPVIVPIETFSPAL
jgi:hypothetical protein